MVDTRVHRGGGPRKQDWEEDPCVTVNRHVCDPQGCRHDPGHRAPGWEQDEGSRAEGERRCRIAKDDTGRFALEPISRLLFIRRGEPKAHDPLSHKTHAGSLNTSRPRRTTHVHRRRHTWHHRASPDHSVRLGADIRARCAHGDDDSASSEVRDHATRTARGDAPHSRGRI